MTKCFLIELDLRYPLFRKARKQLCRSEQRIRLVDRQINMPAETSMSHGMIWRNDGEK